MNEVGLFRLDSTATRNRATSGHQQKPRTVVRYLFGLEANKIAKKRASQASIVPLVDILICPKNKAIFSRTEEVHRLYPTAC